jgi:hypothetical protein
MINEFQIGRSAARGLKARSPIFIQSSPILTQNCRVIPVVQSANLLMHKG